MAQIYFEIIVSILFSTHLSVAVCLKSCTEQHMHLYQCFSTGGSQDRFEWAPECVVKETTTTTTTNEMAKDIHLAHIHLRKNEQILIDSHHFANAFGQFDEEKKTTRIEGN